MTAGRNWTVRDNTFVGGLESDPYGLCPSLPLNNGGRGSGTPVGNQDVLKLSMREGREREREGRKETMLDVATVVSSRL